MEQYGVLIVDDSSFMRRCIGKLIEKDARFFIIGIARNGIDALEKIKRLKPHVVTMDIEMPDMDGIEAINHIMNTCPVPIVVVSKHTYEGADSAEKALNLGAVDFFLKSEVIGEDIPLEIEKDFLKRLKIAAEGRSENSIAGEPKIERHIESPKKNNTANKSQVNLIIIGCSTGGPSALQSILPRFPEEFNIPIVVIQHMPPGFTKPLAERFNSLCNIRVKEIENEEAIEGGTIYICPSGFQTLIEKKGDKLSFKVTDKETIETSYRPSINETLLSVAPLYKERLLTTILTGMGNDGLIGCELVRKHNGSIIVEAEESCIVYGMPKVVFEAGLADSQVPLSKIYEEIISYL